MLLGLVGVCSTMSVPRAQDIDEIVAYMYLAYDPMQTYALPNA